METKRNLKYFTSKGISVAAIIGWVIIALGVVLFMIGGRSLRLPAIAALVVGLGVLIFSSSGKASGDDIELVAGANTLVVVASGDGMTTTTYTVAITAA